MKRTVLLAAIASAFAAVAEDPAAVVTRDRVKNLVSDTPFRKGRNVVYWDATADHKGAPAK